jgi:hypothetical protein
MSTVDRPATADEGYALVRDLIFHQVYKFRRRYGGEVDELMGEANLAFVRGHAQFQGGRRRNGQPISIPYSIHIRYCIWFELFDAMRARLARKAKTRFVSLESCDPAARTDFDMMGFVDGLSADARYATQLVLDPPTSIATTAEAKGGEPRNYRSTVRTHLKHEGWETKRINAAFAEIQETLG